MTNVPDLFNVHEIPAMKFPAGRIVATAGIHELIVRGVLNPVPYLLRHLAGDWGDVPQEDRDLNDRAIGIGQRLLSAYDVAPDLRIWIITEADRSCTTILLPSEY